LRLSSEPTCGMQLAFPPSGNGTPADDVRGRAGHGGTDAGLPGRAGRESAGRGNAWGGGGEPGKLLSGIPPGAAGGLSRDLPGKRPGCLCRIVLSAGEAGDGRIDWGAIRARVLVASGAHDFLWPPAIGRQVAALIPGARFEVMEDAGHFPHLQAPETLVRLARSFLDG
jgi:pimeloyl-ACP methyl ester carboxylesterase